MQEEIGIEALCVGIPDPLIGEDLGILIKWDNTEATTIKNEILSCLKTKTHRNFKPNHILLVRDFPLNENLKRDRKKASHWIQANK